MAWTAYHYPRAIAYFAADGTGWVDTRGGLSTHRNIIMVDSLVGTATSSGQILASDCRALLLTDFGFDAQQGQLRGIEVETQIDRSGRVIDQTLQLAMNGELIGRNQARDSVADRQIYGSESDLWGLTTVDYASSNFGLVLDLRANAQTPSSERPILREVMIRLYFA